MPKAPVSPSMVVRLDSSRPVVPSCESPGTVLDRLMQSVGQVAEGDQQTAVEELTRLPDGVAREEHSYAKGPLARPKRMYVSCDGVLYPTR